MPVSLYYTSCSPIIPNCQLFTDNTLTTPVAAGYYSDGVNCFTITGNSGIVQSVNPCPTTTTTTTTVPPVTCQFVRFVNISDNELDPPATGQYKRCTGQPGFYSVSIPYQQTSNPFCIQSGTASVTSGLATIQLISGTCPTAPATSTLTFTEYKQGNFKFTLSTPILANIVITAATVTGFSDGSCITSVSSDTISSVNPLTILALATTGIVSGNTHLTLASTKYKKVDHITINGVVKYNGDTITIGGTIVTIVINTACTTYTH